MPTAKKKPKTYNTYAAGGKVNAMTFDQVKEGMANGTVKLAKKSFAYGGKMYNQGGKPDFIDIDGDGNKTELMKDAAKDAKTPSGEKGMMVKKANKGMMVKGVDVSGLTKRQQETMKKHSKHHTKKHLQEMTNAMLKGSSFTASHKAAQKKVGS